MKKIVSLFALLVLLMATSIMVRAEPANKLAAPASPGASVIRIASGTLRVFSDGSMITEDRGRLEILADTGSPPGERVAVEVKQVEHTAPQASQEHRFSGSESTVIRILSGTLHVLDDGSMLTEDGGQIEIVPDPGVSPQQPVSIEVEKVETVETERLDIPCYKHTAWVSFGSTSYRRETSYCVNGLGNEVVKEILVTNTGASDTPILNREILGRCGIFVVDWWQEGPWIIGPGATLRLEPWTELGSGWGRDGKVGEEWRGGPAVDSCLPENP